MEAMGYMGTSGNRNIEISIVSGVVCSNGHVGKSLVRSGGQMVVGGMGYMGTSGNSVFDAEALTIPVFRLFQK